MALYASTTMLGRAWIAAMLALAAPTLAYMAQIEDRLEMRQTCSGMYAGPRTGIDGALCGMVC